MASLERDAARLLSASTSTRTQRTYQAGVRAYRRFCEITRKHAETAVSEDTLCLFLAHLHQRGLTAETAQVYLAGVRHRHLELNLDLTAFSGQRVTASLRGMRRLNRQPRRTRPAVTTQQLTTFKARMLNNTRVLISRDAQMVWTAVSVAFFGLLRVGEYTAPSPRQCDAARTLTRSCVNIAGGVLTLRIRRSKTDQHGAGSDVVIGPTGNDICPVAAMTAYLANTAGGRPTGPLFQYGDGTFLTAEDVNHWLATHIDPETTSHCLRIGGATRVPEIGTPTWQLQACGRWQSNAYRRYLRPVPSVMATLAASMAGNR